MAAEKDLQRSLAGLSRWATKTPEQRAEHMQMMRDKKAEKDEARRKELEARGEVVKPRRRDSRRDRPMAPLRDLLPLMAEIQVERETAGLPALSQEALMRDASLRIRRAIAESTLKALKDDK
ncbi:hypothetical protein GCM10027515_31920 [Schumannella luteola]|uniref:Uncharacterized protein n=1 Tax=Schumannella luteola TaxID=472059 RepID=A0A852YGQ4_9MICO|nr:hypothetical protein [Schumannella luteola]NYG99007.1 hypothetical protein [Schumannella luteola]